MDKPDINNMLYFIVPQGNIYLLYMFLTVIILIFDRLLGQEATESKNSNIQGSSRTQSGVQNSRNRVELSSKYEQHIYPLKEKGVEPTYFPYIKKLPGKPI